MGDRLIITDNREDPGNPLVLHGEDIDAAAEDPLAIGKLMVDQVWAEGTDPTGGGLYYERNSNQHRRLGAGVGRRRRAPVGSGRPPRWGRWGGGGQSRSPAAAVAGASLALMGKAKAPSFLARLRGQLAQQLETDDPPMAPVQRG